MSRKRTRAAAKRRRRSSRLTPEQRLALDLQAMAKEQHALAAAERAHAAMVAAMLGDDHHHFHPKRNDLDRWEMAELARRNRRRAGDDALTRLPAAAYEARRLRRYADRH